ncbi:MAG: hypothetical protein IJA82_07260 [Clostridia bacterium]|nr:hypothetical protein [Clostridia bacterium]
MLTVRYNEKTKMFEYNRSYGTNYKASELNAMSLLETGISFEVPGGKKFDVLLKDKLITCIHIYKPMLFIQKGRISIEFDVLSVNQFSIDGVKYNSDIKLSLFSPDEWLEDLKSIANKYNIRVVEE